MQIWSGTDMYALRYQGLEVASNCLCLAIKFCKLLTHDKFWGFRKRHLMILSSKHICSWSKIIIKFDFKKCNQCSLTRRSSSKDLTISHNGIASLKNEEKYCWIIRSMAGFWLNLIAPQCLINLRTTTSLFGIKKNTPRLNHNHNQTAKIKSRSFVL